MTSASHSHRPLPYHLIKHPSPANRISLLGTSFPTRSGSHQSRTAEISRPSSIPPSPSTARLFPFFSLHLADQHQQRRQLGLQQLTLTRAPKLGPSSSLPSRLETQSSAWLSLSNKHTRSAYILPYHILARYQPPRHKSPRHSVGSRFVISECLGAVSFSHQLHGLCACNGLERQYHNPHSGRSPAPSIPDTSALFC